MLDYDPVTKLYLVKRVEIPSELQECEKEALSRQSLRSTAGERKPKKKDLVSPAGSRHGSKLGLDDSLGITHSRSNIKLEQIQPDFDSKTSSGEKSKPVSVSGSRENIGIPDAIPVPGGGCKVAIDASTPKGESPTGKGAAKSLAQRPSALNGIKMKEGGLESENGAYYWVPRVRVMFAAEDPRVFSNRVAHAHLSRSAR